MVGECGETSRKAGRRPHLLPVFRRGLDSDPFPQGWRALANVYGDQECRTVRHPHEFAHGRVPLKVQPPDDAPAGTGLVILREMIGQTEAAELTGMEGLHEIAPLIF